MIDVLKLIGNSFKYLFEIAPYFKLIIVIIIIGISFKFTKLIEKILYFVFIIAIYLLVKIFIN